MWTITIMARTLKCSNFRTFSLLAPQIPVPIRQSFLISFPSIPQKILTCFLPLWICVFWTYHIWNLHVFLCLAYFTYNVFKVHLCCFLCMGEWYSTVWTHFCLPIHQLMDIWVVSLSGFLNKAAMNNPIFKMDKWFKHTFLQKRWRNYK